MAIEYLKGRQIFANSTDSKPIMPTSWLGAKLHERDTGKIYFFDGAQWIFWGKSDEAKQFTSRQPRTSLVKLFGDEFAQNPASGVWLLEDLTEKSGGTSLTNNGSITFAEDDDLPLRGFKVPTLDGSTQYFSLPTEAAVEVGTGSFIAGIKFKTTDVGSIFQYGDGAASEQQWGMEITAGGLIDAYVDDGTNTGIATDTVVNRCTDNEWHTAIMVWDAGVGLYLIVDGELVATDTTGLPTLTLNNVGESFYIGTRKSTGLGNYLSGQFSNFQLYKAVDWNVVDCLTAGIRKSATNHSNFNLTNNSNNRFNNRFDPVTLQNEYTNCVINTDEGYYDLLYIANTNSNQGIVDIKIDGITYLSADTYSAGLTRNVKFDAENVFLPSGTHLLEVFTDSKNGSSSGYLAHSQIIELNKREGSDEGGATKGILFFDELQEETNATPTQSVQNAGSFNTNFVFDADGEWSQGRIAFKQGLYKFTCGYRQFTSNGKFDFDVGGVPVFDQVDTNGSSSNQEVSRFAFIDGGISLCRIALNDATNTDLQLYWIRFELVDGASQGDEVEIFGADDDGQAVTGSISGIDILTSARFNHNRGHPNSNLDEFLLRRYFSGGTYLVKFIHEKDSNQGILDIGLDANGATDLFNQLDTYNASSLPNEEAFTTISIAKGFHDVHFKVNGKNASSSAFFTRFSRMVFKKIGESPDAENDDNFDGEFGEIVPLAYHKTRKAESSIVLNLGGASLDKRFSKITISIIGSVDAALALQFLINDIVSGYRYITTKNDNGTVSGSDVSAQTEIELLPSTLLTTNTVTFVVEFEITFDFPNDQFKFASKGEAAGQGHTILHGDFGSGINFLEKITVQTSTSTVNALTEIKIRGHRR